MNVVDSSGWLEYFTKGNNGPFFLPIIQDTQNLVVPTITIYEVFKRVLMTLGEETALYIAGVMSSGQEMGIDRKIAIDAAYLSADLKLAMADSIILATARACAATLWTQDEHFKGVPDVRYIEKRPQA